MKQGYHKEGIKKLREANGYIVFDHISSRVRIYKNESF